MMVMFVSVDRGAGRSSQGAAEDGAIPAAEFVAEGRPGCTPKPTTDGRVQRRVVSTDIGRKDDHRYHQISHFHFDPQLLFPGCSIAIYLCLILILSIREGGYSLFRMILFCNT